PAIYPLSLHDALPIYDVGDHQLDIPGVAFETFERGAAAAGLDDRVAGLAQHRRGDRPHIAVVIDQQDDPAAAVTRFGERRRAGRSEEHTSELQSRGHL